MYYTVTFEMMGHGTAPSQQYIVAISPSESLKPSSSFYPSEGGLATRPTDPVCAGFEFVGWFKDELFNEEWDFSSDRVLRNVTIYAKWVKRDIDWYGNRYEETYTFRRVAWSNWQEHESYDYITSGSIEQSTSAETKISGSFEFEGYEIPDVNDLIRVYYSFKDDYGTEKTLPIATLFISYASLNYIDTLNGIKSSGTLEGKSVLSVLLDKKIIMPKTIPSGSNAVYEAETIIRECGLRTDAEDSPFCLTADHTFDSGSTYLDIVNWLLSAASYTEAYPDEEGIVQLKSYSSSQMRNDYIEFANDENSIMYPEIQESNSWQETPNVVRLIYNTDEACIVASASNLSGSRASLESRGNREITYAEEISDLGDTGSRANALKELAESTLKAKSSDIEYVTMNHAYVPLMIYDPVRIRYSDMEWEGNVDNMSIDLSPSTKTQTKIKRELSANIEITSEAQTYRGE